MKLFKVTTYALAATILAFAFTSCEKWLDVNTDPNKPSSENTPYEQRLAHIEFYTNSSVQFGTFRSNMGAGDWTRNYNGGNYWNLSYWNPSESMSTTPYQWWFVGAYANIPDMISKAEKDGNYQFVAVGNILKAYGFMAMADLYGEMPFYEAAGENSSPKYNSGKTIFLGCVRCIDKAISLLENGGTLESDMPKLADYDWWNNGDTGKWLKLAYLLKARWLNKLNKKSTGDYLDGKLDYDEILYCLDRAMQSNDESTIIHHVDENNGTHDVFGWNEPIDYSPLYSVCGGNSGYMATKMLYDNLTNFSGYGIEDPRADHILSWAYCIGSTGVNLDDNGYDNQRVKWNGHWRRTLGVDMASQITSQNGPLRANYNTETDKWYVASDDANRQGDTVYVEQTSYSTGFLGGNNMLYYRGGRNYPNSAESGSFYTRSTSPTYVGAYPEVCFIYAEVYLAMGKKDLSFEWYKKGIRASCELMNERLSSWVAEDPDLQECPSFAPMSSASIDNFVESIANESRKNEYGLGHILTQKRLAMMFSFEIWNDMRRYDYNEDIFFGWSVPAYHYQSATALKSIPAGKTYRRWRQSYLEYDYNAANLQAIGDSVPGADTSVIWNKADDVWTINVWWDSDQE